MRIKLSGLLVLEEGVEENRSVENTQVADNPSGQKRKKGQSSA